MRRPAGRRFGRGEGIAAALLGFAIAGAACWSGNGAATADGQASIGNRSPATSASDLAGPYLCAIADNGYAYPAFPCHIERTAGRLELAKTGGSQRFTGALTPAGRGALAFDGRFYCPYGSCDRALHGTFVPDGPGHYTGSFDAMTITLARGSRIAASPAGGIGYGGATYGGASYGGNSSGVQTIPLP